VSGFTTQQVKDLTSSNVTGLTSAQVVALTVSKFASLDTADLRQITTSQIAAFGAGAISVFNTTQVGFLTTAQLAALTTANVSGLAAAGLNFEQFSLMESDDVRQFGLSQVQGLSNSVLSQLTSSLWTRFTSSQLDFLTPSQRNNVDSSEFAAITESYPGFQTDQTAWTSSTNTSATPLVLDLDGDGVRTLSIDRGVKFDLDADGKVDRVGWVGAGDGLLARDLDGDGQIDDGSELFGEATVLEGGVRAKDGFEALAALDTNRDGKLDVQDEAFASLRVWSDADADGVTDAGELRSLADLGITSIATQAKAVTVFDEGNLIGLTANYTRSDGTEGEVADVWFRVSEAEALDQKAAALGDALTSYEAGASATDATPEAPRVGAGDGVRTPTVAPATPLPTVLPRDVTELAELLKSYRDVSGLQPGSIPLGVKPDGVLGQSLGASQSTGASGKSSGVLGSGGTQS